MKIAVFDTKSYDREFLSKAAVEENDISFRFYKPKLTPETAPLAVGYDGICIFVNDIADAQVLQLLHSYGIKLIALRCSGFNNVDVESAEKLGMTIVRVPKYSPYAVAEHTIALLLALNRKVHRAYYRTRDNNFSIQGLMGFDLNGKTAGVVGLGAIGKILTKILNGFGMNVLAFDPFPDKEFAEKNNVEIVSLESLFKKSKVICLNCPLTPETKHMVNSSSLNEMADGVFIINTGRGELIDTKALIMSLKSKRVGGAGLDVYEEESQYFFEDMSDKVITDDVLERLLTFPNVLITSHQAYFTIEAIERIMSVTLNSILSFSNGESISDDVVVKHK